MDKDIKKLSVAHDQRPIADWGHILRCYNELLVLNPSPVVALNRAVAVCMHDGPAEALAEVADLEPRLRQAAYPPRRGLRGYSRVVRGGAARPPCRFTSMPPARAGYL